MKISNIERINLNDNRLLPSGAMSILNNVNWMLKELNLSGNSLNARVSKKAKEDTKIRKIPNDLTDFESPYTT